MATFQQLLLTNRENKEWCEQRIRNWVDTALLERCEGGKFGILNKCGTESENEKHLDVYKRKGYKRRQTDVQPKSKTDNQTSKQTKYQTFPLSKSLKKKKTKTFCSRKEYLDHPNSSTFLDSPMKQSRKSDNNPLKMLNTNQKKIDQPKNETKDNKLRLELGKKLFQDFFKYGDGLSLASTASTDSLDTPTISYPRFRRVYDTTGNPTNLFYDGYYGSFEVSSAEDIILVESVLSEQKSPRLSAAACLQIVTTLAETKYKSLFNQVQSKFPSLAEYRTWEHKYYEKAPIMKSNFMRFSLDSKKYTDAGFEDQIYPPPFGKYIELLNSTSFLSGASLGSVWKENSSRLDVCGTYSKCILQPDLGPLTYEHTKRFHNGDEFFGPENPIYIYNLTVPPHQYQPIVLKEIFSTSNCTTNNNRPYEEIANTIKSYKEEYIHSIFCLVRNAAESLKQEKAYWKSDVFGIRSVEDMIRGIKRTTACQYSRNTMTFDEYELAREKSQYSNNDI